MRTSSLTSQALLLLLAILALWLRWDAMANSHCVEAGGHLIQECEDYRK